MIDVHVMVILATRTFRERANKMASRFAAVSNEDISQINEKAVPEKKEEGDKIRFGSFYR